MAPKFYRGSRRMRRVFSAPILGAAFTFGCGNSGQTQVTTPTTSDTSTVDVTVTEPKPADVAMKGVIRKYPSGNCWLIPAIPECPEGTLCNPPPPLKVACASSEHASQFVTKNESTEECFLHENVSAECPPGVMCNPPPPQKISCDEPR